MHLRQLYYTAPCKTLWLSFFVKTLQYFPFCFLAVIRLLCARYFPLVSKRQTFRTTVSLQTENALAQRGILF